MSLRRRAATRGSTTPMRTPLLHAMSRFPSGVSSTESPGFTWASFLGSARSVRYANPVFPVSSTKIATGALLPSIAGTILEPASTSSIRSRSMFRSAMRFVGSSARAAWYCSRAAPSSPSSQSAFASRLHASASGPSSRILRFVSAASAQWAWAAWAMARSMSWRFTRGADGADAWVSSSGKVTERGSFRSRRGARGSGARMGAGREHPLIAPTREAVNDAGSGSDVASWEGGVGVPGLDGGGETARQRPAPGPGPRHDGTRSSPGASLPSEQQVPGDDREAERQRARPPPRDGVDPRGADADAACTRSTGRRAA